MKDNLISDHQFDYIVNLTISLNMDSRSIAWTTLAHCQDRTGLVENLNCYEAEQLARTLEIELLKSGCKERMKLALNSYHHRKKVSIAFRDKIFDLLDELDFHDGDRAYLLMQYAHEDVCQFAGLMMYQAVTMYEDLLKLLVQRTNNSVLQV